MDLIFLLLFGPTNNVGGGCRLLQCAADMNEESPDPLCVPDGVMVVITRAQLSGRSNIVAIRDLVVRQDIQGFLRIGVLLIIVIHA